MVLLVATLFTTLATALPVRHQHTSPHFLRRYDHSYELHPQFTFFWTFEGDQFYGGVEVETTGWAGIGFSELTVGGMKGSDMVIAAMNPDGEFALGDYFSRDFITPELDTCQDVTQISVGQEDGKTFFEFSRLVVTGDSQDRPLDEVNSYGTHPIVFAWGTGNFLSYHEGNRGAIAIHFDPDNAPTSPPTNETVYTEFLAMGGRPGDPLETYGYEIAENRETQYACRAIRLNDIIDEQDIHITSISISLDPQNNLQHHMLVHMCDRGKLVDQFEEYAGICGTGGIGPGQGCRGLLYGWAPGVGSLDVPLEAGFRGSKNYPGFEYIVIEMHYDNPNFLGGFWDNSGVTITYTTDLRQYDASTMTLGDPYLSLWPIPPGQEYEHRETLCPSRCTRNWDGPINVFGAELHMHETGDAMWTKVYRDNAEGELETVGTINRAEYYDFAFQQLTTGIDLVLEPGDTMYTHCHYDTRDRTTPTPMGLPSKLEMCMHFVNYYPRQEIDGSDFQYCGTFGPLTMCGNDGSFPGSIMPIANPGEGDPNHAEDSIKQFGQPCEE